MAEHDTGLREAVRRKGSLLHTLRTVGWAFFGIRRRSGLEEDVGKLNPLHLVVIGILCAAVFVFTLVMLVRWVIASGVAG